MYWFVQNTYFIKVYFIYTSEMFGNTSKIFYDELTAIHNWNDF